MKLKKVLKINNEASVHSVPISGEETELGHSSIASKKINRFTTKILSGWSEKTEASKSCRWRKINKK